MSRLHARGDDAGAAAACDLVIHPRVYETTAQPCCRLHEVDGTYTVKIAAPQVKPEPNTLDRIRSPFFTLPCWRQ